MCSAKAEEAARRSVKSREQLGQLDKALGSGMLCSQHCESLATALLASRTLRNAVMTRLKLTTNAGMIECDEGMEADLGMAQAARAGRVHVVISDDSGKPNVIVMHYPVHITSFSM